MNKNTPRYLTGGDIVGTYGGQPEIVSIIPRWQYWIGTLYSHSDHNIQDRLDELGLDGWELVIGEWQEMADGSMCFSVVMKRPVPASELFTGIPDIKQEDIDQFSEKMGVQGLEEFRKRFASRRE